MERRMLRELDACPLFFYGTTANVKEREREREEEEITSFFALYSQAALSFLSFSHPSLSPCPHLKHWSKD